MALWPEVQDIDPTQMKLKEEGEMNKAAIKTLTERYVKALACRPKEYIVVPVAGWPEWPTEAEAMSWASATTMEEANVYFTKAREVQQNDIAELLTYLKPSGEVKLPLEQPLDVKSEVGKKTKVEI